MLKIKGKIAFVLIFFFILIGISACSVYVGSSGDSSSSSSSSSSVSNLTGTNMINSTNTWTIMVYLDADNNLDSYGVVNFNEMEAGLTNTNINVIVLYDRPSGGDWGGARLYQILHDSSGVDSTIRSARLAGTINGVSLTFTGVNQNLNMGVSNTLADFVIYAKTNFPASNYMLVLWDHGQGWRSFVNTANKPGSRLIDNLPFPDIADKNNVNSTAKSLSGLDVSSVFERNKNQYTTAVFQADGYKSVCQDQTSGSILNNADVRIALTGKGIKVLGFDACLMGMIESAYEFTNVANYMVASADSEPGAGWDYNNWLKTFGATGLTTANLYNSVISSYSARYAGTMTTTMAVYDLTKIGALFTAFDNYVSDLFDKMWNAGHTNYAGVIFNTFNNNTEQYDTLSTGGNEHLDIWDMANQYPTAYSAALKTAVGNAVVSEWHQAGGNITTGNPNSHGIAVYFGTFADAGLNLGYATIYTNTSINQFSGASFYPQFLADLYAFPDYTWISNNQTVSSNMPVSSNIIYQFYVDTTGPVTINLTVPANCDDDLYLLNYTNAILTNSKTGSTGQAETINFNTAYVGWYYILVNRYGSTVPSNQFTMTLTSSGAVIH